MPCLRESLRVKKAYIVNVAAFTIGDRFKDWVRTKTHERHERVTKDKNLTMNMDPEVYKAFSNSKQVSVSTYSHPVSTIWLLIF